MHYCNRAYKSPEAQLLYVSLRGIIVHLSAECLSYRRNLVPPLPTRKRVFPPLEPKGEETLSCGWGGGETHFRCLDRKPVTVYSVVAPFGESCSR